MDESTLLGVQWSPETVQRCPADGRQQREEAGLLPGRLSAPSPRDPGSVTASPGSELRRAVQGPSVGPGEHGKTAP